MARAGAHLGVRHLHVRGRVELSTILREATQYLNGAVGLGGLDPGQEVLQLGGREAVLRVAAAEREFRGEEVRGEKRL